MQKIHFCIFDDFPNDSVVQDQVLQVIDEVLHVDHLYELQHRNLRQEQLAILNLAFRKSVNTTSHTPLILLQSNDRHAKPYIMK